MDTTKKKISTVNEEDDLKLKELGARIRKQREIMHYTREELGAMVGVTGKFIADIEGGVKGMSLQTLNRLAGCLHLSADFILGRSISDSEGESAEAKQIKDNIMATLSVCDIQNLHCFDQMARYFVQGAVIKDKD